MSDYFEIDKLDGTNYPEWKFRMKLASGTIT